jgi:HD-GYP domain-containing protein (c-di-GMP phosphodiesterase class II)
MTVGLRRLVVVCGLVPTFAAAALCLYRPSLLARIDWRIYDTMVRAADTHPPDSRVVIVDVDEQSLTEVGQWPWRRDLIAKLIGNLRDLGASIVALDIMFAESDRSAEAGGNPDAVLADALHAGGVVLGYALTFDDPGALRRQCVHHPLGLAIVRDDDEHDDDPFFRAAASVCNLPHLARAAGASGFMNAAPDVDGILRRVPLVVELEGQVYPALALAAVSAATGTRSVALRVANVDASTLLISHEGSLTAKSLPPPDAGTDVHVPLDGKSNLLLRYRGVKHTFPYVSAVDVMNGQARASAFKDKVVFVGTSALGTREVVSTPLDTVFTGVEVQATVADNLLQQDFLRRPGYGVTLEALTVLALGLLAALLVARFGLAWGAVSVAVGLVGVWAMAISLLSEGGAFLSPLFPTIGLSSALAFMTGAQVAIERMRADRAGREKVTTERVMVQALLSLVEIRDTETGQHSRRTQQYTRVLAQELANRPEFSDYLTPERIDLLSTLAPLHDIGKVGVPDRLLNKPGVLTADELLEMRKHPIHGRDVILKTEREVGVRDDVTLTIAKDIVYTHHEKWDGTGYPQGLRGTDIPIAGRLIALVDVYDAVHSRRVYHQPMRHDDVVAFIVKGSGTHFDPAVVDAFVKVSPILQQLADQHDAIGESKDPPCPGR